MTARHSWPGKCRLAHSEKSTCGPAYLHSRPITSLRLGLFKIVTHLGYNSFWIGNAPVNLEALTHLEVQLLDFCWSPSASPLLKEFVARLDVNALAELRGIISVGDSSDWPIPFKLWRT
ncbi:hypothetical protein FIBSPDRAFT_588779 [Athelia psychrophila]|uniref:Uncharacterized protein n=1 Tax=Athelia psychrophila TaxID=1759441 RepID=A0A166H6S7_9AGAM|nr:hypothetical protein FIBSPDRAFT_255231 [Fibularhizoctonia sp. CBS 109695]KZP18545.1 hypothetical protein FIBSPDRAFT_588779 [Fibularhizoctonia sp. CBS 109695]